MPRRDPAPGVATGITSPREPRGRLLAVCFLVGPGPLARFYDRFGIKETDMPAGDTADKPVPVAVG
ncbi:hypothetical protein [Streptomyces chartreusis]|uniref:hypothetical protein n=1 Tax=Streptomyces chartreusis TaxID=1969 RepID=UPI0033BAA210